MGSFRTLFCGRELMKRKQLPHRAVYHLQKRCKSHGRSTSHRRRSCGLRSLNPTVSFDSPGNWWVSRSSPCLISMKRFSEEEDGNNASSQHANRPASSIWIVSSSARVSGHQIEATATRGPGYASRQLTRGTIDPLATDLGDTTSTSSQ
jgi:hypothetical protein